LDPIIAKQSGGWNFGHERRKHPRSVVVIDAACDLPQTFVESNYMLVLPLRVNGAGNEILDNRDLKKMAQVMETTLKTATKPTLKVQALDAMATQKFLTDNVEPNRDHVVHILTGAMHPNGVEEIEAVASNLAALHKRKRQDTNFTTQFDMWVLDSRAGYAGGGVLAYEAVRQFKRAQPPRLVLTQLSRVRRSLHTLLVPTHADFRAEEQKGFGLRQIAARLGALTGTSRVFHSTGDVQHAEVAAHKSQSAAWRSVFEDVKYLIECGLESPIVNVSYAGHLDDVKKNVVFQMLRTAAQEKRVQVLLGPMGLTGASAAGVGALSIGFTSQFYPRT
jgi:fatty acid-binding protein DegV